MSRYRPGDISGEHIPVVLKRAGRVVATKTVQITADVFEQQVQFEIEPEEVGEFTYTVSVAPHLGEALTENNQADFPLSVARDKIRVLSRSVAVQPGIIASCVRV